MNATKQVLSEFHRFAEGRLSLGTEATRQALLDEWIAQRAHEQSVAGIRESLQQSAAGQGLPVREAFDEVRRRLGRGE